MCNLILALRKHSITSLPDLINCLVYEVDRHITDRLIEEQHKAELDNCLFAALGKVSTVAPTIRKSLWKFAV